MTDRQTDRQIERHTEREEKNRQEWGLRDRQKDIRTEKKKQKIDRSWD